MNSITVYTKPLKYDSQVRISAIKFNNAIDINTNYYHHVMEILRLKGTYNTNENVFAYTFGLTFKG